VGVVPGYYKKYLDDTDTAQAGNLTVTVYKSGYLRCTAKCQVLVANAFNARYTSTLQAVNATQIEGSDATDQLDSHDGNPPSAAEIWQVATRTITGGTVTTVPPVTLANGAHGGAAATITLADYSQFRATGFSTLTAADVSAAVWDAATATYGAAGSYGLLLEGLSASAIADAVWDELIAGHTIEGSTGAKLSSAASAGDPWSTVLPGAYGVGTAGYAVGTYLTGNAFTRLGAPTGASVSADLASLLGDVATILKLVQAGR